MSPLSHFRSVTHSVRHRARAVVSIVALSLLAAGCGPNDGTDVAGDGTTPVTVRLGYLPNVTHATAIIGVRKHFYADALGSSARLKTATFNAGPAAIEALFSGAIDAAYVGPSPTVNGFVQSKGEAVRVVAGATSAGAFLVVRPDITAPDQLRGKKIATPQLGNTQDVALRYWLKTQGLASNVDGGGDVSIVPQPNPQILTAFATGSIDGAWVPEPNATRLLDAGAKVLVDEKTLWPQGKFVTTNLIVNPTFLKQHRDVVKKLLAGQVATITWLNAHPEQAQTQVGAAIAELAGKPLPDAILAKAWRNLTFTNDPVPSSLLVGAQHAAAVGTLTGGPPDLKGLYDLSLLNEVLAEQGQPQVQQP